MVSSLVHRQAGDGASVALNLHERRGHTRAPQGDTAVVVAQVNNGIGGVVSHGLQSSKPSLYFNHWLASGGVEVAQCAMVILQEANTHCSQDVVSLPNMHTCVRTHTHTHTHTYTHHRDKEEMVRKEGQPIDVVMFLEAVQLHACVVIDVEIPLLGHSKEHLIMQEPAVCITWSDCRDRYTVTYCTSLTVSLTWNSAPSRLSFQSIVAM